MIHVLRPLIIALAGALGVSLARDHITDGPFVVAAAALLAAICVTLRERGGAIAALGIGAAGAFATPAGLGPLLVAAGVVVSCDVSAVDRRLAEWRDPLDAAIALPSLAGLAATVAAQPSARGVALGVVAAAAVVASAWRGATAWRAGGLLLVPGLGTLAGFVIALAPDRIAALGDLPTATTQAARSVAAGFAVFGFAAAAGAALAEWSATRVAAAASARPRPPAAHRR